MCDVYEEACFNQKDVYKLAKNKFARTEKNNLWRGNTLTLW